MVQGTSRIKGLQGWIPLCASLSQRILACCSMSWLQMHLMQTQLGSMKLKTSPLFETNTLLWVEEKLVHECESVTQNKAHRCKAASFLGTNSCHIFRLLFLAVNNISILAAVMSLQLRAVVGALHATTTNGVLSVNPPMERTNTVYAWLFFELLSPNLRFHTWQPRNGHICGRPFQPASLPKACSNLRAYKSLDLGLSDMWCC